MSFPGRLVQLLISSRSLVPGEVPKKSMATEILLSDYKDQQSCFLSLLNQGFNYRPTLPRNIANYFPLSVRPLVEGAISTMLPPGKCCSRAFSGQCSSGQARSLPRHFLPSSVTGLLPSHVTTAYVEHMCLLHSLVRSDHSVLCSVR